LNHYYELNSILTIVSSTTHAQRYIRAMQIQ
jgi:hypothetical protein